MNPVLIGVMVVAAIVMIIGLNKQKTGAAWGKPVAILCALVALGCAVAQMMGGGGTNTQGIINIEQRYQQVCGEKLGKYLAEKHSGSTAIILTMEQGGEPGQPNPLIEGLKTGCGTGVTIADTIIPEIPADVLKRYAGTGGEGMSEEEMAEMVPMEEWFNAKMLDEILTKNSSADCLITTVGLPADWVRSKFVGKGADKVKVVMTSGNIYEMKGAIGLKKVVAAVSYNPNAKYEPKMPPSDLDAAFDKRFLLITPDNVSSIASEYPGIFAQ